MTGQALDIGIGILELALAGYVLRRLWGFRRGFPWLLVPTGFFLLRGIDRLGAGLLGGTPRAVGLLLDPLVLGVLLLLLLSIDRIVSELAAAEAAAAMREREYERALLDYRRLARHRLATPLTVILGGVRFLLEAEPDDVKQRAELAAMIEDAAARLEKVSLDPRSELDEEERSLRPTPALERDGRYPPPRAVT